MNYLLFISFPTHALKKGVISAYIEAKRVVRKSVTGWLVLMRWALACSYRAIEERV